MNPAPTDRREPLDWAVAFQPCRGETCCGDAYLVQPTDRGVLLAVVDGLGHGPRAAEAARAAVAAMQAPAPPPLDELVRVCHEAVRRTRGVAMTVAAIDVVRSMLGWLAIGNVEGLLWRARPLTVPCREAVTCRGGIVGYQLPSLIVSTVELEVGDTLALATDGVRTGFLDCQLPVDPPQSAANRILAEFGRGTDDALVLVARYRGGAP